jgi:hypothetical protein
MPRLKKSLFLRNLAQYDVLVEDTSSTSPYFQVTSLPPKFSGGRNSFLIEGSLLLQNKSKVLIEILDANGRTIYNNIVRGYEESNSKLVSVEIYDDTAVGFATIIIMGKAILQADGSPIPPEWQNKYNVRWARRILTDYYSENTSPLRFFNNPRVFAEEYRFKNIYNPEYTENRIPFPVTLSPIIFASSQVGYRVQAVSPVSFSADYFSGVFTGSLTINENQYAVDMPISSIQNSTTAFVNNYLIGRPKDFIQEMLLQSGSYQTTINTIPANITSSVELQYPVLVQPVINAPTSFASLRIVDLNTVSGEIKKVRIYQKSVTDGGEFKIIGDIPIVTQELLVTQSERGNIPYGAVHLAPEIDNNWIGGYLSASTGLSAPVYPISGSLEYYTSAGSDTASLAIANAELLGSIRANISLAGNQFAPPINTTGYFIGNRIPINLFPQTEYTLQFNAKYTNISGSIILSGNAPRLDIYLVGAPVVADNPLGQKIATVTPLSTVQFYENIQFNFAPNVPTEAPLYIRFVVSNGFWYFSNISLKPAEDIRFSPDETQIIIPNTDYYKQVVQYKVEFFTIDNSSVPISAVSIPTFFTGSVIDLGLLPTPPLSVSSITFSSITSTDSEFATDGSTTITLTLLDDEETPVEGYTPVVESGII